MIDYIHTYFAKEKKSRILLVFILHLVAYLIFPFHSEEIKLYSVGTTRG